MFSESDAVAIRVRNLSKRYQIYDDPKDRLKQSIVPRLQKLAGRPPKQYFRDFWALHDVSFDVRKGETVGVVGKNGAGKSTLLHLIVGTHAPTAGSIDISGRVTALLELGSGFHPMFTGRENVYMNAAIMGLSRAEVDRRFDEIAAFADIGLFMEQPVNTYSSGMYLRLAFAVQVCFDPDILIVDEALAVGDAYFVHRCFHRIRQMKEQGKTILFVSHDTASVNNICDRALWISDGRLRLEGKPDDVTASYRADLFRIPMSPPREMPEGKPVPTAAPAQRAPETIIPNVDLRMGFQRCKLTGVGLYDGAMLSSVSEAKSGGELTIRVSYANESLPAGAALVLGYVLCTPRGEEFGGVNTRMKNFAVAAPRQGATGTLRMHVSLPVLHAGHYALTVAVASLTAEGEVQVEDRVENAIVFQVLNDEEVVGLLRFPTSFEVE
jgi:homopolymeric O-antigen transport system ATP-binding protein